MRGILGEIGYAMIDFNLIAYTPGDKSRLHVEKVDV
jgi:hypothetical protein